MQKFLFYITTIIISSHLGYGITSRSGSVGIQILSESASVQPGKEFMMAVKFVIDKGWHIYWLNPGDSGIPTEVEWNLPEGVTISQVYWPAPQIFKSYGLVSYGYNGTLVVPVKLKAGAQAKGAIKITARASWLVCKEKCIPGKAEASISLNTSPGEPEINKSNRKVIDNALSALPVVTAEWQFIATKNDNTIKISIKPPLWFGKILKMMDFIPFAGGVFSTADGKLTKLPDNSYSIEIALDQYRTLEPEHVEALLYTGYSWVNRNKNKYIYIKIPIINN